MLPAGDIRPAMRHHLAHGTTLLAPSPVFPRYVEQEAAS
jgi:hypothetical protein